MTEEEVAYFDENKESMNNLKEQVLSEVISHNPYDQNFQILDTDYSNFMIMYTCQQHKEMTNMFG